MRALVFALACGLVACSSKTDTDGKASALKVDPAQAALLDKVGDRVAVVALFDLQGWRSLHGALAYLLAEAPEPTQQAFSMVQNPLQVPELAFGKPLKLDGLDRSRPLVVGLGEAPFDELGAAAVAVMDGKPIPGLIHRAVVPATNAEQLATAIEGLLRQFGARSIQVEEGTGWLLSRPETLRLAVIPRGDHVYIVAESESTVAFDTAPVWGPPLTVTAPARTPAFLAAAGEGHALGALFRPARFRAAAAASGAVQFVAAMAQVSGEYRTRMHARGMQILLGCEGMMADGNLDFVEHFVGVRGGEKAMRVRTVSAPTVRGAKALAAALKNPRPRLALKGDVLAEAWFSMDAEALLAAAPSPFSVGGGLRGIARQGQECGSWGLGYMVSGGPLGLSRQLYREAGDKAALPLLVQVAAQTQAPPTAALALEFRPGADLAPYRKLVKQSGSKETLSESEAAGHPRAFIGQGVVPREVFADSTVNDTAWAGFATTGSKLKTWDWQLDQSIKGVGAIEARAWWNGAFLVGELVATTRSGKAVPASLKAGDWQPRELAGTPAAACLARALAKSGSVLGAVSNVAPEDLAAVLTKGMADLDAELRCAAADPKASRVATAVRGVMVKPVVETLAEAWRFDAVAGVLEAQCAATKDKAFCAGVAAAKTRGALALPVVRRACGEGDRPGHADVRILLDDTIQVDGAVVAADALDETLRARLAAARQANDAGLRFDEAPEGDDQRRFGTVEIAVGPGAKYAELARLLAAAEAGQARQVAFPVRHGAVRWATVGWFVPSVAQPTEDRDDDRAVLVGPDRVATRALNGAAAAPVVDAGKTHPIREKWPESRVVISAAPGLESAARFVSEAGSICGWVEIAADLPQGRPAAVGDAPTNAFTKPAIREVLRANQSRYRYCYERQLARDPRLSGALTARFTILSGGEVQKVEFIKDTMKNAEVASCLSRVIGGMKFPKAPAVRVVNYPFIFRASD